METPGKFTIANLSIRKLGSSSVLTILLLILYYYYNIVILLLLLLIVLLAYTPTLTLKNSVILFEQFSSSFSHQKQAKLY